MAAELPPKYAHYCPNFPPPQAEWPADLSTLGVYVEPRSIWEMDDAEIQDFCVELFMGYDVDSNGCLDRKEFKAAMRSSELGFNTKEIRAIMAEADENGDGLIEYKEFLPLMVQIIHSLKAKHEVAAAAQQAEEAMRKEMEMQLLHGISKEELEGMMASVFQSADTDGSGGLSKEEFRSCLKSAELGLTKKEINLLLSECDVDGDGNIVYSEFVPLCFDVLVERFKDQVMQNAALQSDDGLQQMILTEFQAMDKKGTGFLNNSQCKTALTKVSSEFIGLTQLQICSLLSNAAPNGEGNIDYAKFSMVAAAMIWTMVDLDAQTKRVEAIQKMSQTAGAEFLHGHNEETVKAVLMAAFKDADADGNGTLEAGEIIHVLGTLGAGELSLTESEIQALIATVDSDGDGRLDYVELVNFMYDVLTHLNRENFIYDTAFDAMLSDLEKKEQAAKENQQSLD
eukprot:CAMPEP_0197856106 /NCGR_PEP_ID=MMETSP1438-20131217/27912_1 /TAXON_ID=1461541 /ORGANISM="Pterosperma sp., Strain CCMP1384" /LENGTH=454 /DNA_ID=CAMNT_0043471453 /DNA_START=104 /DNA_END=1468 /DNA_ORIENTATION=+